MRSLRRTSYLKTETPVLDLPPYSRSLWLPTNNMVCYTTQEPPGGSGNLAVEHRIWNDLHLAEVAKNMDTGFDKSRNHFLYSRICSLLKLALL